MKAPSSSPSSLQVFVSRVSAARRLNFGDLRRLQRDVLPDGAATRQEVEALIALDGALDRVDEGWPAYLASTVKAFMARPDRQAGDTAWLVESLYAAAPKTALGVARAVASLVDEPDDALRALAKMPARRKAKAAACATGLSAAMIRGPATEPPQSRISFTWPEVRLGEAALTVRLRR